MGPGEEPGPDSAPSEALLGAPSSPGLQRGDFSVPTSLFQENLI